ncbi:MAG: glycosyltransferase family 2 protein [Pseudomonadota bacterium]
MIGIIVPARDEEERIEDCVQSLITAASVPGLAGEAVQIIVVLDACSDRTGTLARSLGARTIDIRSNNVGLARQTGAKAALAAGARWLAFTDADSVVSPDWLTAQIALEADAVCGTIAIEDWGAYGERMHRHFELTYTDKDGHSHIHGANLGVSAQAYATAGGFLGLETGEDVALIDALQAIGARIAWSRAPRVVTSVRPNFRAPGGFGATLQKIETLRQWVGVEVATAA